MKNKKETVNLDINQNQQEKRKKNVQNIDSTIVDANQFINLHNYK